MWSIQYKYKTSVLNNLTTFLMMQRKVAMTVIMTKTYRKDIRLTVKMVVSNQSTCMIDMNMTWQNRQLLTGRNKAFVKECDLFAVIWVGLFGSTYTVTVLL